MSADEQVVEKPKGRRKKNGVARRRAYVVLVLRTYGEGVPSWEELGTFDGTGQRACVAQAVEKEGPGTYKAVNARAWDATFDVTQEVMPVTQINVSRGQEE